MTRGYFMGIIAITDDLDVFMFDNAGALIVLQILGRAYKTCECDLDVVRGQISDARKWGLELHQQNKVKWGVRVSDRNAYQTAIQQSGERSPSSVLMWVICNISVPFSPPSNLDVRASRLGLSVAVARSQIRSRRFHRMLDIAFEKRGESASTFLELADLIRELDG